MCRSIVFTVFVAIFHSEIQKTIQSKPETPASADTEIISNININLTHDEFIDKPKETTEKYKDLDKPTNSSDGTDTESNESNSTKAPNLIASINITIPIMVDKVTTADIIEDISKANTVHNTNKSFEGVTKHSNTNGNNSKDVNEQNIETMRSRRYLINVEPSDNATNIRVPDAADNSFSNFTPTNFLQKLAGRMILPMLKAHQKLSGGVSKGVHGVQEVGSGTLEIAAGTFNLIRDAARSILKT